MESPARLVAAGIGLCLCLWPGPSALADGSGFHVERPVIPGAVGPNRLPVDVTLLLRAAPGAGLRELRLYEQAAEITGQVTGQVNGQVNREVPYLLVSPSLPPQEFPAGKVLAVAATREHSGFEVDFGRLIVADRLEPSGISGPLLKRARLEASGDRRHWNLLAEDATVFDLPDEHLQYMKLDFVPGAYRYFRVTWDDRMSTPPPLPTVVRARAVEPERLGRPPLLLPLVFERRAGELGTSRFRIRLPWPQLPIVALSLGCGGGHLLRAARILEPRLSGDQALPATIGQTTLRRIVRNSLSAAELRISLESSPRAELELVVDDGDNPPLALAEVVAEIAPQPFIYFEARSMAPLIARYGDTKRIAPHYDLEAVRDTLDKTRTSLAAWGPPKPVDPEPKSPDPGPGSGEDSATLAGPPMDRSGFSFSRAIAAGRPGLSAVALDVAVLAHAASDFRDLRILDGQSRQVPFLLEKRDEPLAIKLAPIIKGATPGQSIYDLQLPQKNLPPSRMVLTTPLRVFQRSVALSIARAADGRSRSGLGLRREIDRGAWAHADPESSAPPLFLDVPTLPEAAAELAVDEGDNGPLPLGPAELLLPAWRLRYFRDGISELTLLYGRADLSAPRYDLALLAPRFLAAVADETTLSSELLIAPVGGAKSVTGQEMLFWGVLLAAVLALLALIGVLVKKGEQTS